MTAKRVAPDFRAALIRPANTASSLPALGDPKPESLAIPRDSRSATRGVRGQLRWNQTRLGLRINETSQAHSPKAQGSTAGSHLEPDWAELSEKSRIPEGRTSSGSLGDATAMANETLADLLAELQRRGLGKHPRAKALLILRQRLMAAEPRSRFKAGEGRSESDAPQTIGKWLQDAWDALLGLVQSPQERLSHRRALLLQAKFDQGRGDLRGASRKLKLLLDRDPSDGEVHACLGHLYMGIGNVAAAEPHLLMAAKLRPNKPSDQLALGVFHYRIENPREALLAFGKALRLQPENSDANAWLGILAHEGNRPAEAIRFLERAISFDPSHAVARYYLAQASLSQGDAMRASHQLEMVKRLDPAVDLDRFSGNEALLPSRFEGTLLSAWVMPKLRRTVAV